MESLISTNHPNDPQESPSDTRAFSLADDMFANAAGAVDAFATAFLSSASTLPIAEMKGFKPDNELEEFAFGVGSFLGFMPTGAIRGGASITRNIAKILAGKIDPKLIKKGVTSYAKLPGAERNIDDLMARISTGLNPNNAKASETLNNIAHRMDQLAGIMPGSVPEVVGRKADELFAYGLRNKVFEKGAYGMARKVLKPIHALGAKNVNEHHLVDILRGSFASAAMFGVSSHPFFGFRTMDDMWKSMAWGSAFGLIDRGVGNLIPDHALLRAAAGATVNSAQAIWLEDAPTSKVVFDFLVGAFYGAQERPYHYNRAMDMHRAVEDAFKVDGLTSQEVAKYYATGIKSDKLDKLIKNMGPIDDATKSAFVKTAHISLVGHKSGERQTIAQLLSRLTNPYVVSRNKTDAFIQSVNAPRWAFDAAGVKEPLLGDHLLMPGSEDYNKVAKVLKENNQAFKEDMPFMLFDPEMLQARIYGKTSYGKEFKNVPAYRRPVSERFGKGDKQVPGPVILDADPAFLESQTGGLSVDTLLRYYHKVASHRVQGQAQSDLAGSAMVGIAKTYIDMMPNLPSSLQQALGKGDQKHNIYNALAEVSMKMWQNGLVRVPSELPVNPLRSGLTDYEMVNPEGMRLHEDVPGIIDRYHEQVLRQRDISDKEGHVSQGWVMNWMARDQNGNIAPAYQKADIMYSIGGNTHRYFFKDSIIETPATMDPLTVFHDNPGDIGMDQNTAMMGMLHMLGRARHEYDKGATMRLPMAKVAETILKGGGSADATIKELNTMTKLDKGQIAFVNQAFKQAGKVMRQQQSAENQIRTPTAEQQPRPTTEQELYQYAESIVAQAEANLAPNLAPDGSAPASTSARLSEQVSAFKTKIQQQQAEQENFTSTTTADSEPGGVRITTQNGITRDEVLANSDKLYLYGDNILGAGIKGDAASMRGVGNAIAIPVKLRADNHANSFMRDSEFEAYNKGAIDRAFEAVHEMIEQGVKEIVVPEQGIGVGDSKLAQMAPKTYEYVQQKLRELKPKVQVEEPNSIQDATSYSLHSGGAVGADSAWGAIGKEFGLSKNNHYYYGKKTPEGNVELTKTQYDESVTKVHEANKTLKRKPGKYMNLLARNWMQVKNADSVFAVSELASPTEVKGGTGWAVQMAIDANKPVYVYDQVKKQWYSWNEKKFAESETPVLTKNFAGIGSRKLADSAKDAIRKVYEKTFKQAEESIEASRIIDSFKIKDPVDIQAIEKGTKRLYLKSKSAADTQGIAVGETVGAKIGARDVLITNRGYLNVHQAGGARNAKKLGVTLGATKQTENWLAGKGKMQVYDIIPQGNIIVRDPQKKDPLEGTILQLDGRIGFSEPKTERAKLERDTALVVNRLDQLRRMGSLNLQTLEATTAKYGLSEYNGYFQKFLSKVDQSRTDPESGNVVRFLRVQTTSNEDGTVSFVYQGLEGVPNIKNGKLNNTIANESSLADTRNSIQLQSLIDQDGQWLPMMDMFRSVTDVDSGASTSAKTTYQDVVNMNDALHRQGFTYIGNRADNDVAIYHRINDPDNPRSERKVFNDVLKELQRHTYSNELSNGVYQSTADWFATKYKEFKGPSRQRTEFLAKADFMVKQLPSDDGHAFLAFMSKASEYTKRLQPIAVDGDRALPKAFENVHQSLEDTAWQQKRRMNATAIKERNRRQYIPGPKGGYKDIVFDPTSHMVGVVVRDPEDLASGNYPQAVKDLFEAYRNSKDNPFDGSVVMLKEVFNKFIEGDYATWKGPLEKEPNNFAKPFYSDGKYLLKFGLGMDSPTFQRLLKEAGLDFIMFDTAEKSRQHSDYAADIGYVDGQSKLDYTDRHLTWLQPDRFYLKFLGHNKPVEMFQQLLDITNIESPGLQNRVLEQTKQNMGRLSALGSDPLSLKLLAKEVMSQTKADHISETDAIDSSENKLTGWDEGPSKFTDGVDDSLINLLASEINNVREIKMAQAIGQDSFYFNIPGKWQYLQPWLPDDVPYLQQVTRNGKKVPLLDSLIPSSAKKVYGKDYAMHRQALAEHFTHRNDTVVAGRSVAYNLPVQTKTRQAAGLAPYPNLMDAWNDQLRQIRNNVRNGEDPLAYVEDLYASGIRVPIGGADEVLTLRVIGVNPEIHDAVVHPEAVDVLQGDLDGDKMALIFWDDPDMLDVIKKYQNNYDASKIQYYQLSEEEQAQADKDFKAMEKSLSRPLTESERISMQMRAAKQQVGIISNARMLQSQLRHMLKIAQAKGRNYVERIQDGDTTVELRPAIKQAGSVPTKGPKGRLPDVQVNDVAGAMLNMMSSTATDSAKSLGFPSTEFVKRKLDQYTFEIWIKPGKNAEFRRLMPDEDYERFGEYKGMFTLPKLGQMGNQIKNNKLWGDQLAKYSKSLSKNKKLYVINGGPQAGHFGSLGQMLDRYNKMYVDYLKEHDVPSTGVTRFDMVGLLAGQQTELYYAMHNAMQNLLSRKIVGKDGQTRSMDAEMGRRLQRILYNYTGLRPGFAGGRDNPELSKAFHHLAGAKSDAGDELSKLLKAHWFDTHYDKRLIKGLDYYLVQMGSKQSKDPAYAKRGLLRANTTFSDQVFDLVRLSNKRVASVEKDESKPNRHLLLFEDVPYEGNERFYQSTRAYNEFLEGRIQATYNEGFAMMKALETFRVLGELSRDPVMDAKARKEMHQTLKAIMKQYLEMLSAEKSGNQKARSHAFGQLQRIYDKLQNEQPVYISYIRDLLSAGFVAAPGHQGIMRRFNDPTMSKFPFLQSALDDPRSPIRNAQRVAKNLERIKGAVARKWEEIPGWEEAFAHQAPAKVTQKTLPESAQAPKPEPVAEVSAVDPKPEVQFTNLDAPEPAPKPDVEVGGLRMSQERSRQDDELNAGYEMYEEAAPSTPAGSSKLNMSSDRSRQDDELNAGYEDYAEASSEPAGRSKLNMSEDRPEHDPGLWEGYEEQASAWTYEEQAMDWAAMEEASAIPQEEYYQMDWSQLASEQQDFAAGELTARRVMGGHRRTASTQERRAAARNTTYTGRPHPAKQKATVGVGYMVQELFPVITSYSAYGNMVRDKAIDKMHSGGIFIGLDNPRLQKELNRIQDLIRVHPELKDNLRYHLMDPVWQGKINNLDQLSGFISHIERYYKMELGQTGASLPFIKNWFRGWLGVEYDAERLRAADTRFSQLYKDNPLQLRAMSTMDKMRAYAYHNAEQKKALITQWKKRIMNMIDEPLHAEIMQSHTDLEVAQYNQIARFLIEGGARWSGEGKQIRVKTARELNEFKAKTLAPFIREAHRKYMEMPKGSKEKRYIEDLVSFYTKFTDQFHSHFINAVADKQRLNLLNTLATIAKEKGDTKRYNKLKKAVDKHYETPYRDRYVKHYYEDIDHRIASMKLELEYIDRAKGLSTKEKEAYKKALYDHVERYKEGLVEQAEGIDYNTWVPQKTGSESERHMLGLYSMTSNLVDNAIRHVDEFVKRAMDMNTAANMHWNWFQFRTNKDIQKKLDDVGEDNFKAWNSYIESYIQDNSGMINTRSRILSPKYFVAKLKQAMGKEIPADDPMYYLDISDNNLANKLKMGKLAKLVRRTTGRADWVVDKDTLAKLSALEARLRLSGLLFHPKAYMMNRVGAWVHMLAESSFGQLVRAEQFKTNERFNRLWDLSGIRAEFVDMEMSAYRKAAKMDYAALSRNTDKEQGILDMLLQRRAKFNEIPYEDMSNEMRMEYHANNRAIRNHSPGAKFAEIFDKTAGFFMRTSEEWARKTAFAVGYQQAEMMGYGEAQAIEYARRFVIHTQFSYINADRIDRDRSSMGKVLSRFKQYGYEAFRQNKRIFNQARKMGWDPATMPVQHAGNYLGIMMALSALGAFLPYSLFDLSRPPHIQNSLEMAEMVFSGEPEEYMFHTYGLNTLTSPTTQMGLLPVQLAAMGQMSNPDYQEFLHRTVLHHLPFGRAMYQMGRIYEKGLSDLPNQVGFPQTGLEINERRSNRYLKTMADRLG